MASFTVGLDLGQANDFSALAVVEHVWRYAPNSTDGVRIRHFEVVALRRWDLGTPYPRIVQEVAEGMVSGPLSAQGVLLFDATGVGRAIGDLFAEQWRAGRMGSYPPVPVTFTQESKADMVSTVLVAAQRGRLHIASRLPLASVLEEELTRFRQKIRATGSTSIEYGSGAAAARTEGRTEGHGDLATGLFLAMKFGDYAITGTPRYIGEERVDSLTLPCSRCHVATKHVAHLSAESVLVCAICGQERSDGGQPVQVAVR